MSGFKNKTNWCVITGAPSSGKTSVIEELARRGFTTCDEVARELIEKALHTGRTLDDVRGDVEDLQRGILQVSLAREMALDAKQSIFLDRGIPDSFAYFQLAGLDGVEAEATAHLFQYRAVFIFDRLPLAKDGVRTEDEALAARIDNLLESAYRRVGYTPIRIPVLPIAGRADAILKHIESLR